MRIMAAPARAARNTAPVAVGLHLFYLATLLHLDFEPGPESLEAKLFTEAEIPWDDIAFRTVGQTLRWFFEDRRAGRYGLHTSAIRYTPRPAA